MIRTEAPPKANRMYTENGVILFTPVADAPQALDAQTALATALTINPNKSTAPLTNIASASRTELEKLVGEVVNQRFTDVGKKISGFSGQLTEHQKHSVELTQKLNIFEQQTNSGLKKLSHELESLKEPLDKRLDETLR